ncbi:MAG: aspartate kinase [Bacteroidales bacterium]|jgi:aspartate kinase
MIVHKFGGGILKTPEAVAQMLKILQTSPLPSVVVVSALNKMTNAFEGVARSWFNGEDTEPGMQLIRGYHFDMACRLFANPDESWSRYMKPMLAEIHARLLEDPGTVYDKAYDHVVCYGELLSTALLRTYFEENGLNHHYLDARTVVRTDAIYRDAGINWAETRDRTRQFRDSVESESTETGGGALILTQGFIGSTASGDSVTLGREGSDYTAAIFAYCLDATEAWIWKDVPGILNADPTEFTDTVKIDEMNYLEAIELAYFGAKVIHPKTIKPLQNRSIPLWVRDFWHPEGSGTRIYDLKIIPPTGPVYIRKTNQLLISFQPRDFSFIVEDMISEIFAQLSKYRIKVNLMQHGAISFSICVTADMDRVNSLIQAMLPRFRILYNSDLELVTIRRYTPAAIERMTGGRRILIQQLSRKTARFVLA